MAQPLIVDVEEGTFEREVIERSCGMAVLVDFWAAWCAPCRTLAPILDKLVAEHPAELVLARIDADQAPGLARRFGIRSLPSVLGFRDGAVTAQFEGAQPEPVVRRFITALLPTPADRLTREGEARAATDEGEAAESAFRAALELDVRHNGALLGLARLLAEREEIDDALDLLERITPGTSQAPEAERFAAELRTRRGEPSDDEGLRERLAQDPADLEARLALGRSLARAGRHEEALEQLLEVVKRDAEFDDQAARKAMLDLFAVLGPEDAIAVRYRAELARALFR
jgi:putative thioredoxin